MRAWTFQDHRQNQKLGVKAPWSVGWIDPDGKRRSRRIGSKSIAEKFRRKIEGQLAAGIYRSESRKSWADFRAEYEAKILPRLAVDTRRIITGGLNHFERIVRPNKVAAIKTQAIDDFIAQRQMDPGKKPGSCVSPATINRELRHLKAVLRVANEWGYLPILPKFRKVREAELIGPVISQDHFEQVYEACGVATMPRGLTCEPSDWWRTLLVFSITTGWRINEILSFRRDDLDMKTGAILTRADDNKGNRDDIDYLPDVTLDHLHGIVGFEPLVFYWPHNERTLWAEFERIQTAAKIHLPCRDAEKHECTTSCHLYGFHALRRAYATLNADNMPAPVLQQKMRHKSFKTTLRYIELSGKMKKATEQVFVPDFLKKRKAN